MFDRTTNQVRRIDADVPAIRGTLAIMLSVAVIAAVIVAVIA
ncbi:MAG: hypothetical protein QMB26_04075 [Pseudomonadales bacterium]